MMGVFQRAWTIAMRRLEPEGGDKLGIPDKCSVEDSGTTTIISLRFAGTFLRCHCVQQEV